jgi:outer membrane protein OmpA-like peptidoglycan-associated protein
VIKFLIVFIICSLLPSWAVASPGQSGSSGLINVPSAETLDAGNICVGGWTCYGENKSFLKKSSLVMPVTITMGIGTFWEIYGAYPNIFFNGDEDISGRGTLDIGTKLRFLGGRSSDLKMAVDLVGQRHVSESRKIDGVTDLSAKLVTSYNKNNFGIHVSAGYLKPGSIAGIDQESEYVFGAGAEYMALPRLKLIGEISAGTNRYYVEDPNPIGTDTASLKVFSDYSLEAFLGAQYFLTPHLTFNTSLGKGFGANDAGFKFLFGISSCQGVGTYVKPIPSVGRRTIVKDKSKDALKAVKIVPISTLLLKASAPQTAPTSKLDLEVEAGKEEVLIKPYGQIVIAPQQASSNLTSPVIPVEIPLKESDEEIILLPVKKEDREASAVEYTLKRISGVTQLYQVDVKGPQVPLAPDVVPERMLVYRKFLLPDVIFDTGQWKLAPEGKKMLSEIADKIRNDNKWLYIKIDGHTDSVGSVSYNMDLSLKRAIATATYMISHEGVVPSKVLIEGRGQTTPIASNDTAEGRRNNRRTEILFLVAKDAK